MARLASRYNGKYWMFTINNPTEEEEPPNVWRDVEYVVWQHERGENGTEHIQGYVAFIYKKRITTVRNQCSDRAHWEPRMGDHSEAKAYCMKDDTRIGGPWEHGSDLAIPSEQGERMDLLAVKRKVEEGVSEGDIASDPNLFPTWVRHYKAIERYRRLIRKQERSWITFTTVYWGASGLGKTRRAAAEAGENAYWLKRPMNNQIWWDGYDGQECVVIDEFYGWIPRHMMQNICDRYPLLVENKGGSTPFLAKRIIITSNEPPVNWWKKVGLGAMERRLQNDFGKVVYMASEWRPDAIDLSVPINLALMADEAPLTPSPRMIEDMPERMDYYGIFGTPPAPQPQLGVHEQVWIGRCRGCGRRTQINNDLCLECTQVVGHSDVDIDQQYLNVFGVEYQYDL